MTSLKAVYMGDIPKMHISGQNQESISNVLIYSVYSIACFGGYNVNFSARLLTQYILLRGLNSILEKNATRAQGYAGLGNCSGTV